MKEFVIIMDKNETQINLSNRDDIMNFLAKNDHPFFPYTVYTFEEDVDANFKLLTKAAELLQKGSFREAKSELFTFGLEMHPISFLFL